MAIVGALDPSNMSEIQYERSWCETGRKALSKSNRDVLVAWEADGLSLLFNDLHAHTQFRFEHRLQHFVAVPKRDDSFARERVVQSRKKASKQAPIRVGTWHPAEETSYSMSQVRGHTLSRECITDIDSTFPKSFRMSWPFVSHDAAQNDR